MLYLFVIFVLLLTAAMVVASYVLFRVDKTTWTREKEVYRQVFDSAEGTHPAVLQQTSSSSEEPSPGTVTYPREPIGFQSNSGEHFYVMDTGAGADALQNVPSERRLHYDDVAGIQFGSDDADGGGSN